MNSAASARRAASAMSACGASGLPYAMFSRTVPSNRNVSWLTNPRRPAKLCERQLAHVDAVDGDPTRRRLVEAHQELDDGALA